VHIIRPTKNFPSIILLVPIALLGASAAHASTITGEQIIATFSNPIFAGSVANDPVAGASTYMDNTSTAVYNINNGTTSSNMNWGSYSGNASGFLPDSVLVFVGNTIPSTASTTAFSVGSLTYLNGTSDLDTLLFGATINFYAGSVSTGNFLGSDTMVFTTTNNIFGVPGGLANGDDDYVNICGTFSSICGTSIEAVESSEGGTGVVVNLMGTIVGDPTLNLSSVSLAGGQNSTTNGFLGADPAIGANTPEPGALTLTGCALLLLALLRSTRVQ
jgi:hypothetical protein